MKNDKNNKISYNYKPVLSLPAKMNIFSILAKNSRKLDIELFPYYAISHEN